MIGVGQKIKEIRKKKGLSQEELAETSKLNLRTIQRIENNESEPRGKTLHLICDILNISTEDILDYGKIEDKNYLFFFHLSVLSFLVLPMGNIILPLILWLNKKNKIVGLDELGKKLLNFQIVWSVFAFCSILLGAIFSLQHYSGSTVFIYLIFSLYVVNIILPIFFAICINKGKTKKNYPNLFRFIK